MTVRDRLNESSEQKLAEGRTIAKQLLNGTALVPAHTCRKCGERALVKPGRLEMNEARATCLSGIAEIPEITICLNKACQHVAAPLYSELKGRKWRYGRANVELVDPTEGRSFIEKRLPLPVTPKQRERLEALLKETA